ncbi:pyridoxal 5'-phosphate synthase glutaminase subunit PdxT [Gordonia effusa]|uniref:pyridoxal 5'-phosphate synthase glutaminase subunit PdxT n=1 Tax=Gordonia effusa TaxID=263908 RepID=UPI0006819CE4|nr:pyridoxal 5'-phosphate synthase glutaminase subunit PdxT [Gordonia effusa]
MAARPVIGVLALQGDVREHIAALHASGAEAVPVRRAGELDEIDGIVLPGGESTTVSKLLGVFGMFEPLRDKLLDGLPAYGSCAGMIMLSSRILDTRPDARHLDVLDITVRRNAFGRQVESFEADIDFVGITDRPGAAKMRGVFIRAPWVEEAGNGVRVLARVPVAGSEASGTNVPVAGSEASGTNVPVAGSEASGTNVPVAGSEASGAASAAGRIVAVEQGNVIATSFHPEVTGDRRVHEYFVAKVRR